MTRRGGVGHVGGGSLEHPRQWLGVQWLGLSLSPAGSVESPRATSQHDVRRRGSRARGSTQGERPLVMLRHAWGYDLVCAAHMHTEDARGCTPPPPPLRARASPQHRPHQSRALAEHLQGAEDATRVQRGCVEGAEGRCGRAVQAGGAGGWCGELGGGAVRRGHRVRGGAEAAAERLVVVVVGVVHRVGLREVGRTAAWGVQQLGGHHLYRQRACTVHALRMRCVHAGHTVCSAHAVYSKLGQHRACTERTTAPLPPPAPPRVPPPPRAPPPPRSASRSPRVPGCSKKYSHRLSPWLRLGLGLGVSTPAGCHPAARRGRAPGLAL